MGEIMKAVLIGIVQGISEWLPVSSTGHMIILNEFVHLRVSPSFWELFEVVIQLASVMAVPVLYYERLNPFKRQATEQDRKSTLGRWKRIVIAVLPSGIVGLLLDDWIDAHFFNAYTVVAALTFYGVLFILGDRKKDPVKVYKTDISLLDALKIGAFQTLALIPGTSRSGSTLLGGQMLGIDRATTAEFSFFMALPTMLGAGGLKAAKYLMRGMVLSGTEILILLCGSLTAFIVSVAAMKYLVKYVKSHGLCVFGVYRIILAVLTAILLIIK